MRICKCVCAPFRCVPPQHKHKIPISFAKAACRALRGETVLSSRDRMAANSVGTALLLISVATLLTVGTTASTKKPWTFPRTRPYVVGHRGGAPYAVPEHSAASYELGIANGEDSPTISWVAWMNEASGVDFSECDVCWTKDLIPICRHEPYLSQTTDALTVFPDKVVQKSIDGSPITDVWAEDLTLAEIKSLRLNQKTVAPTANRTHIYNGLFRILTLEEHLEMVENAPRTIGIYPELKHSTYFNGLTIFKAANTTTMARLLAVLTSWGYKGPINSDVWNTRPVFIQSFEQNDLVWLSSRTCIPLVFLSSGNGSYTVDRNTSFSDLHSEASLDAIATYASGFGPAKGALDTINDLGQPVDTGLLTRVQARDFQVHPYTIRPEADQMAPYFKGVQFDELNFFFRNLTCDGIFTDSSTTLIEYFNAEDIAGRGWPQDLRARLNSRPRTCKVASRAERAIAARQYTGA